MINGEREAYDRIQFSTKNSNHLIVNMFVTTARSNHPPKPSSLRRVMVPRSSFIVISSGLLWFIANWLGTSSSLWRCQWELLPIWKIKKFHVTIHDYYFLIYVRFKIFRANDFYNEILEIWKIDTYFQTWNWKSNFKINNQYFIIVWKR